LIEGARKGGRRAQAAARGDTQGVENPGDGELLATSETSEIEIAKKPGRRMTRSDVGKIIGQSSIKVARAAAIIKRAKEELGDKWMSHSSVQSVFNGEASINSAALKISKVSRETYFSEIAKKIDKIDSDIRLQDNIDNVESGSVDHIITDPPFSVPTGYGEKLQSSGATDVFEGWSSELLLSELSVWCSEWSRVIKSGGNIAVFCEERYINFLMEALISNGFGMVRLITWHVTNPESNAKHTDFLDSCRYIVTACMSEDKRSAFRWIGVEQMHNFIEGSEVGGHHTLKHLGERPDYILKWLVERLTNPGEIILDNFAGTGTTGLACRDLKRNFILVEKDAKAFDIIKARLSGLK
jgi:site-specific DNA-methyltransferase (adenine-specific)